jgi:hypothetical protein
MTNSAPTRRRAGGRSRRHHRSDLPTGAVRCGGLDRDFLH